MAKQTFTNTLLVMLIAGSFLTGCGDKQQPSKLAAQTTIKTYNKATSLHGAVSDDKGFAKKGKVTASSVSGQLIASYELEDSKKYTLEIPADTPLPIVLKFTNESGESFTSVVIHPSITQYDINPLTTAIAKKAMSLGGYSDMTMRQAAQSSTSIESADTVSTVDQTKASQHYGGWH